MKLKYLKNVTTLKLDRDKCNGCRKCIEACPHAVYEIKDKKSSIIDKDACMECGACARNCPQGAIEVNSGVGCAGAIIIGALTGSEPTCGPSCSDSSKGTKSGSGCCSTTKKSCC